jgi:hypothetical protein
MAGVARYAKDVERGCVRRQLCGAGRRELALNFDDLFLDGLTFFVVQGLGDSFVEAILIERVVVWCAGLGGGPSNS